MSKLSDEDVERIAAAIVRLQNASTPKVPYVLPAPTWIAPYPTQVYRPYPIPYVTC
jgi:hypothetical protein